jgi:HEPN domain-containing protein
VKEETERWLGKAKEDLGDARFNVGGGRGRLGAFMLQQALEKGLKALHIERSGRYEYTPWSGSPRDSTCRRDSRRPLRC